MKFKKFLKSSLEDLDEIKSLLSGDFSEAFEAYKKGKIIYKGIRDTTGLKDYNYIEPPKNRPSRNTLNIYTTIINNAPEWKEFPRRSVVCSFSKTQAYNYGNVYICFPKNGSKIGICPEKDIWYSFPKVERLGFSTTAHFLLNLTKMTGNKKWIMSTGSGIPKNLKELKELCNEIEENLKANDLILLNGDYRRKSIEDFWPISHFVFDEFMDAFPNTKKGKSGWLYEKLLDLFSPENFSIQKISNLKKLTGEKEIWFDAPHLLMSEFIFNKMINNF